MTDDTNYEQTLDEIFEGNSNPIAIPELIEEHREKSSASSAIFYMKLLNEVTLKRKHQKHLNVISHGRVRADIGGEVLYLNLNSSYMTPCMIIGPSGTNESIILNEFESVTRGKMPPHIYLSIDNLFDNLLKKGIQVVLNKYANTGDLDYTILSSQYDVGDKVKKGDRVLITQKLEFSSSTMLYFQKMISVYQHCNGKVKEHIEDTTKVKKTQNKKREKPAYLSPDFTLAKIWLQDLNLYEKLLRKLQEVYNETGQPFIIKQNDKYVWNIALPGTQKYLIALLYYLHEYNFINYLSIKDQVLFLVCRNTFQIERIDKNNFTLMRSGGFDGKYTMPFKNYLATLNPE